MKNSTKSLSQIFIYLLIIAGAFVMLIPFAWMVDTSFKASSEVSTWPPKWTTKNAKSKIDFQLQIQYRTSGGLDLSTLSLDQFKNFASLIGETTGANTLVLKLNDDTIRRGTITIGILQDSDSASPDDYSLDPKTNEYQAIIDKYQEYKTTFPETYKESLDVETGSPSVFLENFFDISEYRSDAFARRIVLSSSLETLFFKSGSSFKNIVENSLRPFPIDDDETKQIKENLKNEINDIVAPLLNILSQNATDIRTYRRGSDVLIELTELDKIIHMVESTLEEAKDKKEDIHKAFDDIVSSDNRQLMIASKNISNAFDNNIITPLQEWSNLLNLYYFVKDYYKDIQTEVLSSAFVKGKIRTDKEVYQVLLDKLEKWESSEPVKQYIRNNLKPGNVRKAQNILLTYLNGEFNSEIEEYFSDSKETSELISDTINLLKSTALIIEDSEFNNKIRDTMSNNPKYDEFTKLFQEAGNRSGQSVVFSANINKLDNLLNVINENTLMNFISMRWKQTSWIGTFAKIHSDALSELEIIEKPEEIEAVYYRGRNNIAGTKSFEIKFKDIAAVWFRDSFVKGFAEFTFLETMANLWQNYVSAWNAAPFGRYYANTVFVAVVTTILEIIFASMAAFAFAKMDFFGKNFIFTLFLATMMVPGEVLLVPNFITLTVFGWIDTYYALIVPWVISVFAIFLIRQHFMTIPNELYDAAKIDGLSKWKFLWRIMVPLSKPAIITGALLKFVGSWNAFLWVLIVTKSPEYRTLPVGLQNFSSATGTEYNFLMAAATFSIIPVVILFLVTQKYFIAGISRSGLK
ncbi:MAG: ABC transporter permease subunit [Thermotogota bacterium]|nr:ABC transporter permease subunit [Thermotogota bacterium]